MVKQLIFFALPVMADNILQSCYTIADMAIVGRLIGSDGLSAVGVGGILQSLILMVGLGLGLGGQIVLAQQVGADDRLRMKKVIGSFMTLTVIFAIAFGAVGLALTDWLIRLLNTPDAVIAQTRNYYLVCCLDIVFIYGYNGVGAILRGLGESRLPSIFYRHCVCFKYPFGLHLYSIVPYECGRGGTGYGHFTRYLISGFSMVFVEKSGQDEF